MALVRPCSVPRSNVASASRTSTPMTAWPSASSRLLVAAPIPDAEPVTTIVLTGAPPSAAAREPGTLSHWFARCARSYGAAVDAQEGARRVTGRVAGEVEDGADDFVG